MRKINLLLLCLEIGDLTKKLADGPPLFELQYTGQCAALVKIIIEAPAIG